MTNQNINAIINNDMSFNIDAKSDLSDLFDENRIKEVLKESQMRDNIKLITDLHAIIGNGFCTEKELQDLKKHIDKALKDGMCKTGYLTDDDKLDASCVCDLIRNNAYDKHQINMIKYACENHLKNMATGDGHD